MKKVLGIGVGLLMVLFFVSHGYAEIIRESDAPSDRPDTPIYNGTDEPWDVGNEHLHVGYWYNSTGSLEIDNGSSVRNTKKVHVGYNTGANGSLTVSGENSTLESNYDIYVGVFATGQLQIIDGGYVNSGGNNNKNIIIGYSGNSVGVVEVNGTNSRLLGNRLYIGGSPWGDGKLGDLVIENNGLVEVQNNTKLYDEGSLIIDEKGQLWTNTFELTDAGSAKSKIEVRLGGEIPSTSAGLISANSSIALAGDFEVNLVNGYTPNSPISFQIFNAPSISGNFSPYTLPALNMGLEWDESQLNITGILSVTSSSSAVPEPSTYAALMIGSVILGGILRRKK